MSATGNTTHLPLPALLSQALVAYTIEFDNEAEHRLPHRTTLQGPSAAGDGPWLVSLAMWANCMQFLGDEPMLVSELEKLAHTPTNLAGMQRWGYIKVEVDPAGNSSKGARSREVIRVKPKGKVAQEVWRPLSPVIEKRWAERFGKKEIVSLREALGAIVGNLDGNLPDCLPILGYGLLSKPRIVRGQTASEAPRKIPPASRSTRCCPKSFCASPSTLRRNRGCRSPSAQTSCAC